MHDYLARVDKSKELLFPTARGRTEELTGNPTRRTDALAMVKRRECCRPAASISNHSFRATGITIHQQNGGRLQDAQAIAGHADMRTAQLYNRKMRKVARAEVERVQL